LALAWCAGRLNERRHARTQPNTNTDTDTYGLVLGDDAAAGVGQAGHGARQDSADQRGGKATARTDGEAGGQSGHGAVEGVILIARLADKALGRGKHGPGGGCVRCGVVRQAR